MNSVAASVAPWMRNPNFIKVMAGLDMFYNMFPNSAMSPIKMGTLPARYKDCGTLTSLHYSCKLTGRNIKTLSIYMWTETLRDEMLRIDAGGQELYDLILISHILWRWDWQTSLHTQL